MLQESSKTISQAKASPSKFLPSPVYPRSSASYLDVLPSQGDSHDAMQLRHMPEPSVSSSFPDFGLETPEWNFDDRMFPSAESSSRYQNMSSALGEMNSFTLMEGLDGTFSEWTS
jgi:hypothetical protein